jgi:hypothetical protein
MTLKLQEIVLIYNLVAQEFLSERDFGPWPGKKVVNPLL